MSAETALEALGHGLCEAVAAAGDAAAKFAGDFINIESLSISGILSKLKQDNLADVAVKGIVLGEKFEDKFSLNFKLLDDIIGQIYASIVKSHTSPDFQESYAFIM